MFEKASRVKLRFESNRGLLYVEDLWDIPLTCNGANNGISLDSMAIAVNRRLKESDTESFVFEDKKPNELDVLRLDILKHIIAVRLEERKAFENEKVRSDKKQRLMELIAEKEDDTLKGKSLDELRTMVAEL